MMSRALWLLLALVWSVGPGVAAETACFQGTRPVGPTGRETERNLFVGFRAVITTPATEPLCCVWLLQRCTACSAMVQGGHTKLGNWCYGYRSKGNM